MGKGAFLPSNLRTTYNSDYNPPRKMQALPRGITQTTESLFTLF